MEVAKNQWQAVERRSASVPLNWTSHRQSIKLYKLSAFIYLTILEQHDIHDDLDRLKYGIVFKESQESHSTQENEIDYEEGMILAKNMMQKK